MHTIISASPSLQTSSPVCALSVIAPPSTLLPHQDIIVLLRDNGATIHLEQWLSLKDSTHAQALEILFSGGDNTFLSALLHAKSTSWQIDIILQPHSMREKKLLISDMDSTIINQECIDELADVMGLKEKVSAITARAMNGELDFAEALVQRVSLLKGLPVSDMQRVLDERITLMKGARTLIQTLRARGVYCVLVSGGFTFFTEAILQRVGFDAHYANMLLIENERLTGEVVSPILGRQAKRETLLQIASERNIALSETIAIGDGANDLPMILEAGLGIAYHAKPSVEAAASHRIRYNDLTALLFVLGIAESEWVSE